MTEFTKEQLVARVKQATVINRHRLKERPDVIGPEMDNALFEIALAALTAEPEEYIFDHPHGKLFRSISDKSNAGMPGVFPVYRLPLLEGFK